MFYGCVDVDALNIQNMAELGKMVGVGALFHPTFIILKIHQNRHNLIFHRKRLVECKDSVKFIQQTICVVVGACVLLNLVSLCKLDSKSPVEKIESASKQVNLLLFCSILFVCFGSRMSVRIYSTLYFSAFFSQ